MRSVIKGWVFAVLLVVSFQASAGPRVLKLQAWVAGDYTSQPGEARAAFVERVGRALKDWTDETGTEACGPILQAADGTFRVVLTTQKAQTVCLQSIEAPDGYVLTGESIHNHPHAGTGTVRLTAQDKAALRAMGDPIVDQMARFNITQVHVEPATFSPDDYAAGPGYLVVAGRLMYQHGEGTARVVVEHLAPTSP